MFSGYIILCCKIEDTILNSLAQGFILIVDISTLFLLVFTVISYNAEI